MRNSSSKVRYRANYIYKAAYQIYHKPYLYQISQDRRRCDEIPTYVVQKSACRPLSYFLIRFSLTLPKIPKTTLKVKPYYATLLFHPLRAPCLKHHPGRLSDHNSAWSVTQTASCVPTHRARRAALRPPTASLCTLPAAPGSPPCRPQSAPRRRSRAACRPV